MAEDFSAWVPVQYGSKKPVRRQRTYSALRQAGMSKTKRVRISRKPRRKR